jgi:hypothetical protein
MRVTLTPSPSPRGRGEGLDDGVQQILGVLEDELVFKPEHDVAKRFQILVTLVVVFLALGGLVWLAVQFDHKTMLGAEEIHDVVPDLMLPAELEVCELPVSEEFPECILCRGLIFAQFSCPFDQSLKLESPSPFGRGLG